MVVSAPARPRRRLAAALVVSVGTAVASTGLSAAAVNSPALQQAPAAIQAVGASLPFTILEAENAATNGTKIGPSYSQGTLAAEASNRQAVTLNTGQYVEFTAPGSTNAINVAYSVPDGRNTGWPAGQLSEYEVLTP